MWSTLPPELVELIFDTVSLDAQSAPTLKSLSRVARSWTIPCQQRLWRKVTIYTDSGRKRDEKTQLLCWQITDHPYIPSYIHCLHYRTYAPSCGRRSRQIGDLKRIAKLLSCMANITDFTLEYGIKEWMEDTNLAFDDSPAPWQEAVLAVITSPSLRSLTIKGVSRLPAHVLDKALVNLKSLTLFKSHLTWSPSPVTVPGSNLTTSSSPGGKYRLAQLSRIICDSRSYRSINRLCNPPQRLERSACDLSRVQTLDLAIDVPFKDDSLLHRFANLLDLRIAFIEPLEPADSSLNAFLLGLNPAAFSSLTHLSVTIHHGNALPFVRDPLLGLCADGVLPKLTALSSLELELHFDVLDRHGLFLAKPVERGFQSRSWRKLDSILSQPAFANMKTLGIRLSFSEDLHASLSGAVFNSLYDTEFPGLRRKAEEGGLAFAFRLRGGH